MIYFTSDLHFGHKNILQFQKNRKFESIEEMDKTLIKNWNNKVKDNDEIYILGDFTLKKDEEYISNILNQLNGKKYLIKGNHDYWVKKESLVNKFEWIKEYYELKYNKEKFILCHYPFEEWNGSRNNSSYHLHGHLHSTDTYNQITKAIKFKKYDVGIDANNFSPVSIDDIVGFFHDRNWEII